MTEERILIDRNNIHDSVIHNLSLYHRDRFGGGFALSKIASHPTIISLCFAILTAELYGVLDNIREEDWGEKLLDCQIINTGLFVDPLFSPQDLKTNSPGELYIKYQSTYFALNALDALGLKPRYEFRFIEPYFERGYLVKWLESLEWTDPWGESNQIMFVAGFLYYRWYINGEKTALSILYQLLDWLSLHQDSKTGFWGTNCGAPLLRAMAGTYHFLPLYYALKRPVNYINQMIDHTLVLQNSDGLFHPDRGGDSCLDVDAIFILVICSLVTSYREKDIKQSLFRAFDGLLKNQSDDGGFCRARYRPEPSKSWKRRLVNKFGINRILEKTSQFQRQVMYYEDWELMPYDIRDSDLWSTWFRSFGLAIIDSRYPTELIKKGTGWQFRRLPSLGWYDPDRIREAHGEMTNMVV